MKLVVIGAGVIPNVELAEESGLNCDNGISVDKYGQTEDAKVGDEHEVVYSYNNQVGGPKSFFNINISPLTSKNSG